METILSIVLTALLTWGIEKSADAFLRLIIKWIKSDNKNDDENEDN
ncbi:hypothetical protein IQ231_13690 [Cuspidothrix issatschenkoi LEGE 03284]|nr:hypothetical protein [Cuspidothrix issatschenkoi]MBE9232706.1 hypothetical protein [Cuspidothrix issatschenkoi LEGE 03284]